LQPAEAASGVHWQSASGARRHLLRLAFFGA
jgi:hypothetical protein